MGKFTAYKVPLASLPHGIHKFEYQLGKQFFTDMENADIHDADIKVEIGQCVRGAETIIAELKK